MDELTDLAQAELMTIMGGLNMAAGAALRLRALKGLAETAGADTADASAKLQAMIAAIKAAKRAERDLHAAIEALKPGGITPQFAKRETE